MTGGIPQAAIGASVGVLIYSFISFILCVLVVGLLVKFGEKYNYVTILAVFSSVSTFASMVQQIHFAADFHSIKEAEFNKAILAMTTPSLALTGPAHPTDLVLFDIQFYCYNIMALSVLFWAINLFCSAWSIGQNLLGSWVFHAPLASKIFALIFPALIIGISSAKAVQNSSVAFFIVTNFALLVSMLAGSILVILILAKYVKTRRLLAGSANRGRWWASKDGTATSSTNNSTLESGAVLGETRRSIYDRALVTRFSLGFIILAFFEATLIIFTLFQIKTDDALVKAGEPDFSTSSAVSAILFFMPGATTSLVVFLVFGTAKSWRQYHDLVWGGFGIRDYMIEKKKKASSPVLGAQGTVGRDFEFVRFPSLRNQPSDETLVPKRELASRVRMFSGAPAGASEVNAYENFEESSSGAASKGTDRTRVVPEFHKPLRRAEFERQDSSRGMSRQDQYPDQGGVQYGSVVREQDTNNNPRSVVVPRRMSQTSPEAYLEDSSD